MLLNFWPIQEPLVAQCDLWIWLRENVEVNKLNPTTQDSKNTLLFRPQKKWLSHSASAENSSPRNTQEHASEEFFSSFNLVEPVIMSWRDSWLCELEKGAAVKLQRTEGEEDTPWCLIRSFSVDTPAGSFLAMLQTLALKQRLALYPNKTMRRPQTKAREKFVQTEELRSKKEEGSSVCLPLGEVRGQLLELHIAII